MKKFTKDSLQDFDFIQRRNGYVEIAFPSLGLTLGPGGYNDLDELTEGLRAVRGLGLNQGCNYDVVAVRRPEPSKKWNYQFSIFKHEAGKLVYEEAEEMTLEEVCKALGKKIRIVDEDEED